MQMNLPNPTPNERKIIRTWRLSVVAFYGSLCVILLLLSFVSDRTTPQTARAPDAFAAR
jgi:hypothetical protein